MNTGRIFIGEVYEKVETGEDRRVGYYAFYYSPKKNLYRLLGDSNHNFDYSIHPDILRSKYIKEDSLIPYESFGKKGNFFGVRETYLKDICDHKIYDLIGERCRKVFSYSYTDEQVNAIHERGCLTLDEKVDEVMQGYSCISDDSIDTMITKCNTYQNCRECTYASLYASGIKEFESVLKNALPYTMDREEKREQGRQLIKK